MVAVGLKPAALRAPYRRAFHSKSRGRAPRLSDTTTLWPVICGLVLMPHSALPGQQ